ncbi:Di-copper centre-containing protein [Zalerion maritima]|uniref:Di-copper centre-containing protein n=1 Tax=Zalerion maritima TaxID=339359 RepID=A0AAD5RJC6_9PEZI|nr:Di-copper centre-containing protein [Zalerion maritima]
MSRAWGKLEIRVFKLGNDETRPRHVTVFPWFGVSHESYLPCSFLHFTTTLYYFPSLQTPNLPILQPGYWNKTVDVGKFTSSDVLDPPVRLRWHRFRKQQLHAQRPLRRLHCPPRPGYAFTNHCINRRINSNARNAAHRTIIHQCMGAGNFETMWRCVDRQPHSAGYGGIGELTRSQDGNITTLKHVLEMGGVIPNQIIVDVVME